VEKTSVVGGAQIVDTGFASNGLVPEDADPGLGGVDAFGNPLSFGEQYLQLLTGNLAAVVDPPVEEVRPCDFDLDLARDTPAAHPAFFTQVEGVLPQAQSTTGCYSATGAFVPTQMAAAAELASPSNTKMKSAALGSFKVPSLRNVELTGPYMHDGRFATLEDVMEFYARSVKAHPQLDEILKPRGDAASGWAVGALAAPVASGPGSPLAPSRGFPMSTRQRADLVAFLRTLTDQELVRDERFADPFGEPRAAAAIRRARGRGTR
jgi:hypothetical protein